MYVQCEKASSQFRQLKCNYVSAEGEVSFIISKRLQALRHRKIVQFPSNSSSVVTKLSSLTSHLAAIYCISLYYCI